MKILEIDGYLDGGTIKLSTDVGVFHIDRRLCSTTIGSIYDGYPKDDNSNINKSYSEVKESLLAALSEYDVPVGEFDMKPAVIELLNID